MGCPGPRAGDPAPPLHLKCKLVGLTPPLGMRVPTKSGTPTWRASSGSPCLKILICRSYVPMLLKRKVWRLGRWLPGLDERGLPPFPSLLNVHLVVSTPLPKRMRNLQVQKSFVFFGDKPLKNVTIPKHKREGPGPNPQGFPPFSKFIWF